MTVPQDPTDASIILSRKVLAGWIVHPPGSLPEDILRMISGQIATLQGLAVADPSWGEKVAQLIEGWEAMQEGTNAATN